MKMARVWLWLVALLPAAAAGLWASLGACFPEPWFQRQAYGEMSTRWTFAEWDAVQAEPWHPIARVLHLAALQVPGMTIQWTAYANALLALLLVWCVSGVLRRSFSLTWSGRAWAFLGVGLLACAPSFGADWLHGERLGLFLPPLVLAWALAVLQCGGGFGWRAAVALVLAALAPFCHGNGVVVCLALIPPMVEAGRRSGGGGTLACTIALPVVGGIAAAFSLHRIGAVGLGDVGLWTRVVDAPLATLDAFVSRTGLLWMDLLPRTGLDEKVFGAASWLLPFVLWGIGDRSDAARRAAAPWWGCVWFGLLVVLWNAVRHDLALDAARWRELTFGAFLLPVGCVGLLAARLGRDLLPLGGGALLVLAAQDWQRGIEDLRLARMQVDGLESTLLAPQETVGPTAASQWPVPDPAQIRVLEERGWVPARAQALTPELPAAAKAPPSACGACTRGNGRAAFGEVRSSLLGDTPQWVVIVAANGDAPARQVGRAQPEFAGAGRSAPWQVTFDAPLPEGVRVRALGVLTRRAEYVPLGPWFVLRNGELVAEPGA
ncbi:MAG TPA: hypothetical protein VFZ65_21235 [Planctomycetota bacterium]|nr:hypothetical protein [Planctomycetota bacterium]